MIKFLSSILIVIISLIVTLFAYYNYQHYGYEFLWILPLAYSLNIIFYLIILRKKGNIFTLILNIILFSRYIIITFLLTYTNFDTSRSFFSPLTSSYNTAVIIMTLEMMAIFFVAYIFISKIQLSINEIILLKSSEKRIYLIFVLVVISAFVVQPSLWDSISFLTPNEKTISNGETNILSSITFFSLNIARYLLIIIFTSSLYNRYKKTDKNIKYLIMNYFITIFLCLIIFGHNRADFLIPFIAVLVFLSILYKKRGIIFSLISITIAPLVINLISLSRANVSVDNSLPLFESWAMTLQAYLGGVYNVAVAIETRLYFPEHITFLDLLFDIFRPFLGLNIFLQNLDFELTNHLFNYTIYNSNHISQIMPSVGHGYFYFGLILAPLFTILMLMIAYYFMKYLIKVKRIDVLLILLIPILRLTLSPAQNISIIINDISSIIVIFIPIYLLTKVIRI